jgi:hypothetical protein
MIKVECKVDGYHPGTGLDLVAGEMEVTEDQAAQLEAAGLLSSKSKRATKPEKREE